LPSNPERKKSDLTSQKDESAAAGEEDEEGTELIVGDSLNSS